MSDAHKPHCLSHGDHEKRLDKLEKKSDDFLSFAGRVETVMDEMKHLYREQTKVVSGLAADIDDVETVADGNTRAVDVVDEKSEERYRKMLLWLRVAVVLLAVMGAVDIPYKDIITFVLKLIV